ncbi:MAG TPA: hypothetical protein VK983_05875 [Candidatus Limnocylindrales bacterium]|nr:hypothetical protein [Candidatus Limnocylindrales bacterium]
MHRPSERRLVENEVMFRDANRQVQQHVKANHRAHQIPESTKLHFYCECSNFHCRDRIIITVKEYEAAHANRKQFITVVGHENPAVESVVDGNAVYTIVEKYVDPAKMMGTAA